MKVLFVHQNFPGQFGRLAAHLAADPEHMVVTLGEHREGKRFRVPNVRDYWYEPPQGGSPGAHHYIRDLETNVRRGQQVYKALATLKRKGFTPDVVVAHAGWGESIYIKDVYETARMLCYYEYYYRSQGQDVGFEPGSVISEDDRLRIRTKNATHLLSRASCDLGMSPTMWQYSQFPEMFKDIIEVVHDGIDTGLVRPNPQARYQLKGTDRVLTPADEVLTYCARNLEPHRGFHVFMRALPHILEARPHCQVLLIGADGVSYGRRPRNGKTYKELMLQEVGAALERHAGRFHFLGRVPYAEYLSMLQISSAHVYLTYPFILSWSCLEAMAAGGLVIGSRTQPVEEVISHGHNGLLTEFFDVRGLADLVADCLERRDEFDAIRHTARETIRSRYDFQRVCLPRQLELLDRLVETRG